MKILELTEKKQWKNEFQKFYKMTKSIKTGFLTKISYVRIKVVIVL
jgi:hypothetical protein